MAFDPNVLRRATLRLEEQRDSRSRRRDSLRQRTYQREPRLAQLDRQLRGTMAELFGVTLGRVEGSSVEDIRMRNLELQRQRAELLVKMGLKEDSLDETPACHDCGDSGWQGAEMCHCLKELCTQEQMKELSKLLNLGEQSFENFNLDYYSTMISPDHGSTPRENMEIVQYICYNYASKFPKAPMKNLFLTGSTGLGKTFLSACIARTVSERGFSVVYDTAGNIFAQFEAKKFQAGSVDGREARDETRRYLGCDLLILDDLGSELTTQFTQSALYQLVNSRLVAGKHTVISSNLSMADIGRRYAPQIASRLEGEYEVQRFFGEDIRILRKQG